MNTHAFASLFSAQLQRFAHIVFSVKLTAHNFICVSLWWNSSFSTASLLGILYFFGKCFNMVLSLSEVVCALIKVFPVHYRLCHFDAVFSYTYLLTYLLMRLPLLVPLIIFKFLCLLHSSNIFAIFIILLLYSRSLLYFAIVLLLSTMFF